MEYAREIKRVLAGMLGDYRIYVFGSVVRGDSPGLSDMDIAIVSDELENGKKKLEVYDLLFERFLKVEVLPELYRQRVRGDLISALKLQIKKYTCRISKL